MITFTFQSEADRAVVVAALSVLANSCWGEAVKAGMRDKRLAESFMKRHDDAIRLALAIMEAK